MVNRLTVRNDFGFQWMLTGPNTFQVCGRTTHELPAGAYSCSQDNCGHPVYTGKEMGSDEMIEFPDSLPAKIMEELERFWSMGDRFAKMGFLHRRGYLLYGKQGCGKSSLINQIVSRIVSEGNLAFYCDHPYVFVRCMEKFRQVEPTRPIVCIFEDIDAIIENHGDSELLQWLDGASQVDKAVNIATTNYPEKLDKRIVSRPRRFDRIMRIDAPDDRMRRAYFARKMPELSVSELDYWTTLSNDIPFAGLAELVISVCCLGNGLEESAKLLREIDAQTPSSLEFANSAPAPSMPTPADDLDEDFED